MNEEEGALEKSLGRMPLSRVPETLDREVEAMIRRAGEERPARVPCRVPLWAALAACAACTIIGFILRPLATPQLNQPGTEPTVIYIDELPGALPTMLGGGERQAGVGFFERKRGEVTVIYQG